MNFSSFVSIPLKELGEFKNGVNFSGESKGQGLKLINVKDIYTDSPTIDFSRLDNVDLGDKNNIQKFFVQKDDLFFVRSSVKRDGIGVVIRSNRDDLETIHCGFVIRFRLTSSVVDASFLTYLLRSPSYREKIKNLSGGSAITNISQDSLGELQIAVPPLSVQHKIAAVLSTYDGLIENNQRRIAILEEMSRNLYREWFVHFRFPGSENVRLTDSALGMIPEEWIVVPIGAFAIAKGGKRLPKGKELQEHKTAHPYLRVKDFGINRIDRSEIKYIDDETHQTVRKYTISNNDIYISIAGTIGRVGIVPKDLSGANLTENAAKICLRDSTLNQRLLLLYLQSPEGQAQIASKTVGTSQPKLALFRIEEILVPVAPAYIQEQIAPVLTSLNDLIENLEQSIDSLRRTRDLLLPRLVSGEIDVSDLEIAEVEELAVAGE